MDNVTFDTADIDMSVSNAALPAIPVLGVCPITPQPTSRLSAVLPTVPRQSTRLRRFRGFIWDTTELYCTPLATLSEILRLLPRPPPLELENPITTHTLNYYSHLFNISTPINVNRFQQLLQTHPNQPLIQSVCEGLRFGFWPFAEPDMEVFPSTLEVSNGTLSHDEEYYIREYIEEEVTAGRYSEFFGPELLPGMYSMPVYTIPKPHSDKLRLINNHSAGPFSLNNMIDKDKVGMRLNNIQDLGRNLLRFRQLHGSSSLWLYKLDITKAYHHLLMHPL